MTSNAKTIVHGTVSGTPINVDLTLIDHVAVKVTLTANYVAACPMGAPSRPGFTGCTAANMDHPRTILSGTTLTLFKHEADALVTASAATYA